MPLSREDRELFKRQEKVEAQPAEKEKITELPASSLESYPNHKFAIYTGARLDDMIESVKEYGIITPLIVRKIGSKYIILSGHNRINAAQAAGLENVPCIILSDLTDEEAELIVSETNLRQRSFSDLSYSERAYCLADHYNAIKKQGKRLDLIEKIKNAEFFDNSAENSECGTNATREKSRDFIAEKYNLAPKTIAEYVRIATINKELMTMLDANVIALKAAYQLSFINNTDTQQLIATTVKGVGGKVSPAKATALRKLWENEKEITEQKIVEILEGKKAQKMKAAVIRPKILSKYFPAGMSEKEILDKIIALLEAEKQRKENENA